MPAEGVVMCLDQLCFEVGSVGLNYCDEEGNRLSRTTGGKEVPQACLKNEEKNATGKLEE